MSHNKLTFTHSGFKPHLYHSASMEQPTPSSSTSVPNSPRNSTSGNNSPRITTSNSPKSSPRTFVPPLLISNLSAERLSPLPSPTNPSPTIPVIPPPSSPKQTKVRRETSFKRPSLVQTPSQLSLSSGSLPLPTLTPSSNPSSSSSNPPSNPFHPTPTSQPQTPFSNASTPSLAPGTPNFPGSSLAPSTPNYFPSSTSGGSSGTPFPSSPTIRNTIYTPGNTPNKGAPIADPFPSKDVREEDEEGSSSSGDSSRVELSTFPDNDTTLQVSMSYDNLQLEHSPSYTESMSNSLHKAASFVTMQYPVHPYRRQSNPQRTLKPIMQHYGISLCLSIGAALFSMFIAYCFSLITYKTANPTYEVFFSRNAFTQIYIVFCIFGLVLFSFFQYYVFNGRHELLEPKYIIAVCIALGIFIGVPMGATKADFPYYYYHIDILLILILFCGLTFMIGYFGKEEKNVQLINVNSNRAYPIGNTMNATPSSKSPNLFVSSPSGTNLGPPPPSPPIPLSKVKSRDVFGITTSAYVPTQKERLVSGAFFTITEALVSLTALIYGMFFVTLYSSLSDFNKMVWRLIVHPLYFEIFMMIPVRYLVGRKMRGTATLNILYCLSIVHAQSHISTLGRMMFSTLNSKQYTVTSVLLLNVGKFFFRLSSPLRDSLLHRVIDHFNPDGVGNAAARIERQNYIVSAGIQSEIIVENACAIFSGFVMWIFQDNREIFMYPYPEGTLTGNDVIFTTVIQLTFALVFDSLTLYVAESYLRLPILKTWKEIWQRKYRFFGFLLFGLFTMGLLGIFYMGFRVPRATFCRTESVCSCVWLSWMNVPCETFVAMAALH